MGYERTARSSPPLLCTDITGLENRTLQFLFSSCSSCSAQYTPRQDGRNFHIATIETDGYALRTLCYLLR